MTQPNTETHVHVKPAEGLRVPHPSLGRPIRTEGEWVPRRTYFLRRIADGALEEIDEPKPKPKPKAPKKPAPKPKTGEES